MNKEGSHLSHISEERWKKLKQYFEDNSLSLQDRCALLNEITQHKDTEKDVKYNE